MIPVTRNVVIVPASHYRMLTSHMRVLEAAPLDDGWVRVTYEIKPSYTHRAVLAYETARAALRSWRH